jgi:hypothetical protein
MSRGVASEVVARLQHRGKRGRSRYLSVAGPRSEGEGSGTESNDFQAFCCARRYRTKAILPSIFSFAYTWWR